MAAAYWIALEGGEGTGKSTQAVLLAERLQAVVTREPGGTEVGTRMRELLLDPDLHVGERAEALLMAADRAQHVVDVVRPALDAGTFVVSDRSAFSSLAYQGYGRGLPLEEVRSLCDWATSGLWPDVAVLLDVSPAVQALRMERDHDRMEQAGAAFHDRVRGGFAALAAAEPGRWLVVNGEGPIEEVAARIHEAVEAWMAARG